MDGNDARVEVRMRYDLTYAPVGRTRAGDLPAGFHHVRRSRVVGHGAEDFARAAEAVLAWQAQRGAPGVRVEAAGPAAVGADARIRLGPGPLSVTAPARVVFVVDEARRRGFGYGTLPGHPLEGEESFLVDLAADGAVTIMVTAYSRPAGPAMRLAGPVGRWFQHLMAGRYLAAVHRAVRGPALRGRAVRGRAGVTGRVPAKLTGAAAPPRRGSGRRSGPPRGPSGSR